MLFEDLCSFVLHLFYSQGNMVGKYGCIQEPHYFALLKQVCFSFVKQNAFQIVCTINHQKLPFLCPHTDLVLSPWKLLLVPLQVSLCLLATGAFVALPYVGTFVKPKKVAEDKMPL